MLAALTSAGFITVTGTPAPGPVRGHPDRRRRLTGGSEADKAAAAAYLAGQLAQSATGVVVAGPHRLRAADRHGRRHPRRHRAQRDRDHRRQCRHRDRAGSRRSLGLVEQNGGGVGRYGFGENAQAQVPTLAVG